MDLTQLARMCRRYGAESRDGAEALPGFTVYCRDAVSEIEALVYDPVVCLILQGSKVTSSGDQTAALRPGDALLVSHDLPVISRIVEASVETPYMAAILSLDLGLVRALYEQVGAAVVPEVGAARSLSAGPADPAWVEPLIRYVGLMDNPLDAAVLGPQLRREIHYRLLLSPIGGMLRRLLVADSQASRVGRAIQRLRAEFRDPLSVADLARTAGMSPSSFHAHFKVVTGTTPLRYQKDLRLIEARTLLVAERQMVAEAAYAVGYESPTQFSRDYRAKFGRPPSREAA